MKTLHVRNKDTGTNRKLQHFIYFISSRFGNKELSEREKDQMEIKSGEKVIQNLYLPSVQECYCL